MQISRRNALLGATAAVVTGTATAPLAMKAAGVQAALGGDPVVGLAEQLRTASVAWFDAIDALEEAEHRVGYAGRGYDGAVNVEASGSWYCWGASEIRQAVEDCRITPDQRDTALAEITRQLRESQEARRELGIESQWQACEHCEARFWDLQARVLDMPATTPRGVFAKLRSFYHDDEIAAFKAGDGFSDGLTPEYTESIYRDLEHLAGGMPS